MKRVAATLLLLSLFATFSTSIRAQSGRKPAEQGTSGTSSSPFPVSSSTSGSSGSVGNNPLDRQGPASRASDHTEVSEGDVVRVNTTLVTVPVSVMDRDGKYIPNLRQQDFRIYEEGVEQQIAYFATVDNPFTVALVIDTSRSTHFRLEDIQNAAVAFVDQLQPDDRVMVVSFDDHINILTEPTTDHTAVSQAIRRTRTGGSTRLYDAVHLVLTQKLSHINGRKAVVLFTDGVDTTSRQASYESTVKEAEESDALIYPVEYDTFGDMRRNGGGQQRPYPRRQGGILNFPFPFPGSPMPGGGGGGRGGGRRAGGGRGSSRDDYNRADAYLHELAQRSGARFYSAESLQNLTEAFAQVAEELRRQYSLGYYPKPPGGAGQQRQIKVTVNRPGLVVRARDSYIYHAAQKPATAQADEDQPKPELKGSHLAERAVTTQGKRASSAIP